MIDTRLANPLIGRQRHVETIRGWVADLIAGRGRAALIEGEPGIGKSSLVRTVTADARGAGCFVLWASCDELSQAFPLLPLLDGPAEADVVLAGDVFYSRDMAGRVLAFLERARTHGTRVLVGDPGRAYLPRRQLTEVATYDVPVVRALEDAQVKRATVWRLA